MQIEERALSTIPPYTNNPCIAAVAASIQEFGFQQPIVVDADDVILAGHARCEAAAHLGQKTVPVR